MSSEARRRLVCRCMGVSSPRIFDAVRTHRLACVADVIKTVRAGGGCGLCHPEIEEILAEVRGEAIDPSLAIENQLVCRQETLARIEGSLAALIGPRLAALGARVDGVTVDGLHVRVRIGGAASETVARFLAERLRTYVCEDLDIEMIVS